MDAQDLISLDQLDRLVATAEKSYGPVRPIEHPCASCGDEGPWYVAFAFGEQLFLSAAGRAAGPGRRVEHAGLDGAICASCLEKRPR